MSRGIHRAFTRRAARCCAALALLATAAAFAGTTSRVSVATGGAQGNYGGESNLDLSADGRFVSFASESSNLVQGDGNNRRDAFVHDRQTGETFRVSVASDGSEGVGGGTDNCAVPISDDGRYVVFASTFANLVLDDTNDTWDIFVHDMLTGATTRVSVASDGAQGNGKSICPAISADGRFVAFESAASNFFAGDTPGTHDVFLHDRVAGTTVRVGPTGNAVPQLSADGRFLAFVSPLANVVPGDTNGTYDVFVYDRVAATTERASVANDGSQANGESTFGAISADGRYVAFQSAANNLPGGFSGELVVYVRDRQAAATFRVSIGQEPKLSADGRRVAFKSFNDGLVADDTNGTMDVFLRDLPSGSLARASVASDGTQANSFSIGPAISANGLVVGFESGASNLVAGDTNNAPDVFVNERSAPTPSYACTGFESPFNVALSFKKAVNRAIPLKMTLATAAGDPVTDSDIAGAAPIVNVFFSTGSDAGVDVTELLEPVGHANDGNQFRFDVTDGSWVFNLSSKPYSAPGTYIVTAEAGDSAYSISPICYGQFVRLP